LGWNILMGMSSILRLTLAVPFKIDRDSQRERTRVSTLIKIRLTFKWHEGTSNSFLIKLASYYLDQEGGIEKAPYAQDEQNS
jgi:hypothetical protein